MKIGLLVIVAENLIALLSAMILKTNCCSLEMLEPLFQKFMSDLRSLLKNELFL